MTSAEEARQTNPMAQPKLAKVVVNMGIGEGAEKLQKAENLLEALTGQKAVRTSARKSVREWGVREGTPIGCKVTLRGEKAVDFLKRALWVRQGRIADWSFDKQGNLSFGINDHTDFEGQRYDPSIGVFGLDVAVVLEKPGARVARRRLMAGRIPHRHRVTREEAKEFMKSNFTVEVVA
ncbi:MAG: 50S ribosomal protein L5 [Euryarchaeota archaeon]|nr:50S ribosomal protein L5 [Euryarchaeota archaeon]